MHDNNDGRKKGKASNVNKDFTLKAKAKAKDLAFKAKAKAKDFAFKGKDLAFAQQISTRTIKPLLLSGLNNDCHVTRMFHSKEHLMTNDISRDFLTRE